MNDPNPTSKSDDGPSGANEPGKQPEEHTEGDFSLAQAKNSAGDNSLDGNQNPDHQNDEERKVDERSNEDKLVDGGSDGDDKKEPLVGRGLLIDEKTPTESETTEGSTDPNSTSTDDGEDKDGELTNAVAKSFEASTARDLEGSTTGERCSARPLTWEIIYKMRQVFVEPRSYEEQLAGDRRQERIYVIQGAPHSGRFFRALDLSQALLGSAAAATERVHWVTFKRPRLEDLFEDIRISRHKIPKDSYCIVPNFFEQGFELKDLDAKELSMLRGQLEQLRVTLILTVGLEYPLDDYKSLECALLTNELADEGERRELIGEVFDQHKDYYEGSAAPPEYQITSPELSAALEAHRQELAETFTTPPQVDALFKQLSRGPAADHDDFDEWMRSTIKELASPEQALDHTWFSSLDSNHRLYALIVCLFGELQKELIHELYISVSAQLRDERFDIPDSRQEGVHDLRRKIRVKEEEGRGTLRFETPWHQKEVERQISNYRDLIWTAMSTVTTWIEQLSYEATSELAAPIGRAIGRLGVHQWLRLSNLLTDLAKTRPGPVVMIPASALQEVVQQPLQNEALNLIKDWVRSGNPYLKWSAAITIGAAHETLCSHMTQDSGATEKFEEERLEEWLGKLERYLTNLANEFNLYNAVWLAAYLGEAPDEKTIQQATLEHTTCLGIRWALREMFKHSPDRVVALLTEWLVDGEEALEDESLFLDDDDSDRSQSDLEASTGNAEADDEAFDPDQTIRRGSGYRLDILQQFGLQASVDLLSQHRDMESMAPERLEPLLKLALMVLTADLASLNVPLDMPFDSPSARDAVDHVLEILQRWVEYASEDGDNTDKTSSLTQSEKIFKSLLTCLNRTEVEQRERIEWRLHEKWLRSNNTHVVKIADLLLRRARVLNGYPVDPSGEHCGLLLLETPPKRKGLSQSFGYALYRQLSTFTGIRVAALGRSDWHCEPDRLASAEAFGSLESKALLALPLLDDVPKSENIHFALSLTWRPPMSADERPPIHDIEDLIENDAFDEDFVNRVVCVRQMQARASKPKQIRKDPLEFLEFNLVSRSRRTIVRLRSIVADQVAANLAKRTAKQWWTVLQPRLDDESEEDLAQPTLERVADLMEHYADSIEEIPPAHIHADPAEKIFGLFQWLAAEDIEFAIEMIISWLNCEKDDPRKSLARSMFLMLARLTSLLDFTEKEERLEESIRRANAILEVGPQLAAQRDQPEAFEFLNLVEKLCTHAPYRDQLRKREMARLYQFVEAAPVSWRHALEDCFTEWTRNARKELAEYQRLDEKSRSAADVERLQQHVDGILEIAENLIFHLWLGATAQIPEAPEGRRFVLLLVDSDQAFRKSRTQLASLACAVFKQVRDFCRDRNLTPLVFRIGQDAPAYSKRGCSNEQLLPPRMPALPRLAMPILDAVDEDEVHTTILFSNRRPHDWEEVEECYPEGGFICSPARLNNWGDASTWRPIELTADDRANPEAMTKKVVQEIKTFALDSIRS